MSISNLAKVLQSNLNAQLELCRKLEEFADNLPNDVDAQNCLTLARIISPILRQAHEFEESTLFPELKKNFSEDAQLMATLERLRFEHWEDESFADELRESMVNFAGEFDSELVNSLSYMLRGFFEGVRRHAAFEREHILPILHTSEGRKPDRMSG
ncbi:MAG: hemerythrin domain-containing protein [Hyphomicrobiales bacterium]|nr:hemerythrin domain-containing protein [Hyphomicrobiales bacterium]